MAGTLAAQVVATTRLERDWRLGMTSRRIVAELADTVLPAEGRTASVIEQVVRHVDRFVGHMPSQLRLLFPLGLLLLQWGSLVTLMALKPFTLMGHAARERYLGVWARSPFALFRALAGGVRGLILSGYYAMPSVYSRIGYAPDEHLERCLRKREQLVAEAGEEPGHTRSMVFEDIGRSAASR